MKHSKRALALLLAVLMLATSAPLTAISVFADNTDTTIDFDYEKNLGSTDPNAALAALAGSGIRSNTDAAAAAADYYEAGANKYKWRHITAGSPLTIQANDKGSLRYYMTSTSADDKYIVLDRDLSLNYMGNTVWKTITITTDKVLDLNGYTINMMYGRNRKGEKNKSGHYDQSNEPNYHNSTMFTITKGATLTIIDSSMYRKEGITGEGTGGIKFHGYMVSPYYTSMDFYTTRDLFHVDNGNLIIYGGTFQAGRSKEQVKSNFTWDKLKTAIGTAVTLGVSIAEYANGISAAKAALADENEAVRKDKTASSESDDGRDTPKGESSMIEKNGKNQNPTKEQTKSTPSGESSGGPGEGRNQTVGEKNDSINQKNEKDNKETGSNKPTDSKNEQDKENGAKAKKTDYESRIAEKEKDVVNSIVNQSSITGMVDNAFKLVDDIGSMIGNDENSRLTQSILGTVARVSATSTFVAYGGTFKGYGSTPNTRNAVIELAHEPGSANAGKAYIYGGTFEAYTGANVFNFVKNASDQKVYQAVRGANSTAVQSNLVTLKESETTGVRQVIYENEEAVANEGATPIYVNTSSVKVRGGTFRNHYSMYNLAICDNNDPSSGEDNYKKFPGTPGCVNLGIESYDSNFIRDGRIQIEDNYGVGAMVLMDDEKDENTGLYHYRLFCSDQELRYKQYLTVYPNKAVTNSNYSMRLESYYGDGANKDISKAWEVGEGTRDSAFSNCENYFDYEIGDGTAYVMPKLNATNPLASAEELNASAVWYYNTPRDASNNPLPDFEYADTYYTGKLNTDGSAVKISAWKDSVNDWAYRRNYMNNVKFYQTVYSHYRTTMKWFKYKIYRVDPLTKASISETWDYGVDQPLASVIYGESGDSLKCKLPLADLQEQLLARNSDNDPSNDIRIKTEDGGYEKWTGYKTGELYRIVFSIDEYMNYGWRGANDIDAQLDVASTETSIMFACHTEDEVTAEVDPETGHKQPDYTPLQWETAPEAGGIAKIRLTNAQAGLVDYTASGSKIFDVYYQWWEVDPSTGRELALLAGTDNVYTGYEGKDYEYNLAEKAKHKPNQWALDSNGMPTDGHKYLNPVNPLDPNKDTYNANGLPKAAKLWTSSQLHAYTKEICGKEDAKMLNLDRTKNQSLANNNVFKTNSDSCYIPAEWGGKTIVVKAIAVNMKWCAGAYDLYDDYGNVKRFGVAYDKIQIFKSHPVQLGETRAAVTFNSGGQMGKMDPILVAPGSEITLPECAFTPFSRYYIFQHWDLDGTAYASGDRVTVTADTEFTAVWDNISGKISFSPGSGSGTMATVHETVGQDYTAPECTFTPPANKKFDKWKITYTDKNGNTVEAGTVKAGRTWRVNGLNIVFTAQYRDYILSFAPGSDATGAMDPKTAVNGRVTLPTLHTFTSGKTLVGWNLGSKGQQITITDDTTAVAVWGNGTLTIKPGDGSGTAVTCEADGRYVTLPACPFTPPAGKGFTYYTNESGNTWYYKYYPGEVIDIGQLGSKTLVANYSASAYDKIPVTISINSGTYPELEGVATTFEVEKNGQFVYELPDVTYLAPTSGYEFGSYIYQWRVTVKPLDKYGQNTYYYYQPGETIDIADVGEKGVDIVPGIYARHQYTLRFSNGVTSVPTGERITGIPADMTYIYPSSEEEWLVKPEDPVREGYTFNGWFLNASGFSGDPQARNPFENGSETGEIVKNTTLYAQWTRLSYTITTEAEEHGTVSTAASAGYLDHVAFSAETDPGYEMAAFTVTNEENGEVIHSWQWSKYMGTFGRSCGFEMPAANVKIHVSFKEKEYQIHQPDGPISSPKYYALPGEEIRLSLWYNDDLVKFSKLIMEDAEGNRTDILQTKSFIMPACDVSFETEYTYTEEYNNNIFVKTDGNGEAWASTRKAGDGETVTFTVVPNQGYTFTGWDIYDADRYSPATDYTLELLQIQSDDFMSVVYSNDGNRVLFYANFEKLPDAAVTFAAGDAGTLDAVIKGKMKSKTITVGDTFQLPDCGFYTMDCAVFDGWLIGSKTYAIGDEVTVTGPMTVTAKWKEGNHVYYAGGESQVTKKPTCTAPGERMTYCQKCGNFGGREVIPALGHAYDAVVTEPTCAKAGFTTYKCATCGDTYTADQVAKTAHTPVALPLQPATVSADGKTAGSKCSVCGAVITKQTAIAKASKVSISKTKYTYNGKVLKPTLTVKDSAGKTIASKYYTVKWSNSKSKAVGKYTVTVTFKGNYSGSKKLTYTIVPKAVTGVKNASAATKSIKLSWKKVTGAKYYEVYGSTDGKTFKKITTVSANSVKITKVNGKALSAGKTYYFKVRALDSSKKLIGAYSKVLKTGTLTAAPKISKLTSSKAKTATVTWKKVTGASKYIVYKSADGKKWTKAATTEKLTCTLTKLTGGKKIYVKIVAVNAYGKNSDAGDVKYLTVKK